MSIPSHCTLMMSAAHKIQQQLAQVKLEPPKIPIFHNVDVTQHNEPSAIRDILVKQLYSPVQWVDTIHALVANGVTHIAECGPGKILTGLNKRIDRHLQSLPLIDNEAIKQAAITLKVK